jgi:hypothetical protein
LGRQIGRSLPVGYAAISFIAPRRRPAAAWPWIGGILAGLAAGALAWSMR